MHHERHYDPGGLERQRRGSTRYLSFFNAQQQLRSWCEDGHRDEERFRKNGWNPVWSTTSKEDILRWVAEANTPTLKQHSTPSDQTISQQQNTAPRAKSQLVNNMQQAWNNSKARLQLTARQLGLDSGKKDAARRVLEFEEEVTSTCVITSRILQRIRRTREYNS